MPVPESKYLNVGIYTIVEAAALTGVSAGRIRRWLRGYRYTYGKKQFVVPPLWRAQFAPIEQKLALGFFDLVEVKFVNAFLNAGVSWDMIHKARKRAAEKFPGQSHPFCARKFATNGREIFLEVHQETGEPSLLEIAGSQQVFGDIIRPCLIDLEFANGSTVERWWPLGRECKIALDPKRNFGQPSVFEQGIPTRILARSLQINHSVEEVARWFEISADSVTQAVAFETRLAA